MKRCVVYARCSTKDQETENQISQLREYARRQEWEVAEEIVDVCSGGKASKERPGLDKVFLLAHRKAFDVLLFWSLDRLSREGSRRTIQYLTMLDDYQVAWHSYTEPYISSLGVFADCIISLLSALAKQEKIRIGERTRAGLDRARRNGSRIGRPKTPVGKIEEASRLRARGLSFSEIGKEMGVSRSRAQQLASMGQSQTAQ